MESADSAAWSPAPSEVVVGLKCSHLLKWEHVLLVCQNGIDQAFLKQPLRMWFAFPFAKEE